LRESEFSGDHVDASPRAPAGHLDQLLEREQPVAGSHVTLDDRLSLK
jgi:hypothetical protein